MSHKDSRHFLPAVDLSHTCRSETMVYGQLPNREAVPMHASYKFPPETLFHCAQLRVDLAHHATAHQKVGATRIVRRRAKEQLIEEIEETRADLAHKGILPINAPPHCQICGVSGFPELPKVLWVTLSI